MKMRTLAKLLGVALLVAGVAVIMQQRSALARTRAEHEELLSGQQEAEQLREENAELETLRLANAQIKQLERDNRDLPKLRNDVRRLREQAAEAAGLRADNARLSEAVNHKSIPTDATVLPPDFISRASLKDMGLATPEAAVETYFCALCNGDAHRLQDCDEGTASSGPGYTQPTPEQVASQRATLLKQTASFVGYRIASKHQISPNRIDIDVQGSSDNVTLPLHLTLEENEWRVRP